MIRRFARGLLVAMLCVSVSGGMVQAATESARPAVPVAPGAPQPGGPSAAVEPRISKEEALARLKELFTLPTPTERVTLDMRLTPGKQPRWTLYVTIREGNGSSGTSLADVDAQTGRIIRFSESPFMLGAVRTGPLKDVQPEAVAREKAWALVQKLVPERAANLRALRTDDPLFTQNDYMAWGMLGALDSYQFTWIDQQDGIPFPFSSFSVSVHKQTLAYTSVQNNLMEGVTFQAGPPKLTVDEARAKWLAERGPTLAYQSVYNLKGYGLALPRAVKLVYSLPNEGVLDALTGEWATAGPYPAGLLVQGQGEPVPAGTGKPVLPDTLPLTDAAAVRFANVVLGTEEGTEGQLRPDFMPMDGEQVIYLSRGGPRGYASIQLDPETGLIRGADRQTVPSGIPTPTPAPKADPAQEAAAKAAAIAAVQTYYSQFVDQLRLEPMPQRLMGPDRNSRQFRFTRYVDGVPVGSDQVVVEIDLATMTWIRLNASWTTGVTFPSKAGAMDAAKAQARFFQDRQPVLIYRPVYAEQDPNRSYYEQQTPQEAVLAYQMLPGARYSLLDAFTGEPVSWDGQPVGDPAAARERIAGHWAEGELLFLLSRRVLKPEQANPAAPLTRAQAVALLLERSRRGGYPGPRPVDLPFTDLDKNHPAYASVVSAWLEGWLQPVGEAKQFRPDAPITRAEFAVWAARGLGLGALARSDLKVEANYPDLAGLTAEEQKAATFLRALGLLKPAERFRGAEPLTQAEGAALTVRIYNSLLEQQ